MYTEIELIVADTDEPGGGPYSVCWVSGWAADGDPLGGCTLRTLPDLNEAAWYLNVFGPRCLEEKVDGEVVVLDSQGHVACRAGRALRLPGRVVVRQWRQDEDVAVETTQVPVVAADLVPVRLPRRA